MKKTLLYISCCMMFISCERYNDVELDIPFESKLVSVSFIEDGSNEIQLGLTQTTPVFNAPYLTQPVLIKDATVFLSTPNASYQLLYDENENIYKAMMQGESFEEGRAYSISVTHEGQTITGETRIPALVTPMVTVSLDSVFEDDAYTHLANISCAIKEPGTHNIMLGALMVYSDSSVIPMLSTSVFPQPISRISNGQSTSAEFKSAFSSPFLFPVRVDVFIMLCDDAYTKYNNTVKGIDWTGSGIQIGEPVIGFSNMSNGIGGIGAYRYLPLVQVAIR